jgi:hypothetical protein
LMKSVPIIEPVRYPRSEDHVIEMHERMNAATFDCLDSSNVCSFLIKLIALIVTVLIFNQTEVSAAVHNPRMGMDIDARLVTPEMIDYLGEFGFGYIRLQVAAEDLVVEDTASLAILREVKEQCDTNNLGLYLVLDSKTLDADVLSEACKLIHQLPGGPPMAVQIFDDINHRKELSEARYASIVRTSATSLDLPKDSYLLCGGIKGADLDYLDRLVRAGALERVNALTLNIFPPNNGIENASGLKIVPSSDIPAAIDFISVASKLGKEIWIGELGIANSLTGYGVDSFTQASVLPRASLILLSEGASRVTMFTALDPPQMEDFETSTQITLNFGMIPSDLHPRPWGWAIRNMNMLLADLAPSLYSPVMSWAAEFPAEGDIIYHVWFENDNYYVLAFWTETPSAIERRTGIIIYDENVNPVISQNLLSEKAIPAESNRALNMIVTGDLPLSNIPTLVVFDRA